MTIQDNIPPILQNITHNSFVLGTIEAGQSKTVTINGTVPSSTIKGTIFENNATVTTETSATITPSGKVITTVDTLADVDVTKVVDYERPDVGDTVTFTVTAHNFGPSDATNIKIQDIMPFEFANVVVTPFKGTYTNSTGIWLLDLLSGEEANLTLTGKVTAVMTGKNTTNNAIKLSQTETDPDNTDMANATIYVPKSNLYIDITSNSNNPHEGETFTITYKLGNQGPDDALNVTITIPIPVGFQILHITGDGNWTISGNNIIWTFDNVTVGDPFLHISGWTTGPGIYAFGASISSDTYNFFSLGVNSLTINAIPQANAATSTTTNTIGMQNTGTPINYIIMAFLLIMSGLIVSKRR